MSPDGRVSGRDVGSKLVIVMVGLPARGKSYIVKKIARYLNWLQHSTRIFNVGDRRRVAVGGGPPIPQSHFDESALRDSVKRMSVTPGGPVGLLDRTDLLPPPAFDAGELLNGTNNSPSSAPVSPLQMHAHPRARSETFPAILACSGTP